MARNSLGQYTVARRRRVEDAARNLRGPLPTGPEVDGVVSGEPMILGAQPEPPPPEGGARKS